MNKSVLIVEDDKRISALIGEYFKRDFTVSMAMDGAQALALFNGSQFDLVILDIMLPVLDGWDVCRYIRSRSDVPIIMLTAKTDEESHLKGFELGVDDYVAKPFSPKVLLAKAGAILNRKARTAGKPEGTYDIDGGLVINQLAHKVLIDGETINLSGTEFSILLHLAQNKGIVLTRDSILDRVWGESYFGDSRIIDTNIKRIREKLGSKADCIRTIRGVGYTLEVTP